MKEGPYLVLSDTMCSLTDTEIELQEAIGAILYKCLIMVS